MNQALLDFAERGEVVVLAGAGVSMIKPTALPGWKPLNQLITEALRQRLESALERPDWLKEVMADVDASRNANRFPPDYQAQIIEEMCGNRYFHGLQSLDVDVTNAAHDGLAVLAEAGKLKALVTTNFDRLLEKALERRSVPFHMVCEDAGFLEMAERFRSGVAGPLPVIKIHGCVSKPDSMIDTLKQRRRGRSSALAQCLYPLFPFYWLYLGFSAADLEDNPQYLGLVEGASQSRGATYLTRSFEENTDVPKLDAGAHTLMNAYGDKGEKQVMDAGEFLTTLCKELGLDVPPSIVSHEAIGSARFRENLNLWVATLSVSATGLCLAALLEADGQAEAALRVLDRLVRKDELREEHDTEDSRALQFHYGRLGAAWGRSINVPDAKGAASNLSVESMQSLIRVLGTEWDFAATGWLAPASLWLNDAEAANKYAMYVLEGFALDEWQGPKPRTDEEAIDAWLAAAQVCVVDLGPITLEAITATVEKVLERARRCGDVVRSTRVAALHLLALAGTNQDVPAQAKSYAAEFEAARRVGDGFASAMRALAMGQWGVSDGGHALAVSAEPDSIALQALNVLEDAAQEFQEQGLDPWRSLALMQKARAFTDLRQSEQALRCLFAVNTDLQRFPILRSHLWEAQGYVLKADNDQATLNFQEAVQAAAESGLFERSKLLSQQHASLRDSSFQV